MRQVDNTTTTLHDDDDDDERLINTLYSIILTIITVNKLFTVIMVNNKDFLMTTITP